MCVAAVHLLAVQALVAFTPLSAFHHPSITHHQRHYSPLCLNGDDWPGDVDDSATLPGDPSPDKMAYGWQEEVEKLLSPSTKQADREVILKDLLSRGPEIANEVTEAIGSGDLSSLVPPDGESKRVVDDLQALQRQITDDLIPQAANDAQQLLSDPTRLQEEVARIGAEAAVATEDVAQAAPGALGFVGQLLQDPERAAALVQQEARNAVSRTPEGLEMPRYTVLSSGEGYEVREYESCSVVKVELSGAAADGGFGGALAASSLGGYNALAAYFLGANAMGEPVDLTSPVRVDAPTEGNGQKLSMSLLLPSAYTASTAPAPTNPSVKLTQYAKQTFAIAKFSGLATDGEVRRGVAKLRRDAERGGVALASPYDAESPYAYCVLQYNPPYTLPWLRTNEVAVPIAEAVEEPEPPPPAPEQAAAEPDAAAEAEQPEKTDYETTTFDMEEDWEDLAPSD